MEKQTLKIRNKCTSEMIKEIDISYDRYDEYIDLKEIGLYDADFYMASLCGCNFKYVDFSDANFEGVFLSKKQLDQITMHNFEVSE